MMISEAASAIGLRLDSETTQQLETYVDLLLETNRQFNLTAIRDPLEAEERLISETIAILPLLPDGTQRIVDVGSGGGVPGIPLAILRPDVQVDLVEATRKKVTFLEPATQVLGLTNVRAIHARSEEFARRRNARERYDVVVARAVARLPVLAELTLPLTRVGGVAILPKGQSITEELEEARTGIGILGGKPRPIFTSPIGGAQFVVIDKVRPTPDAYPRRPGIPQKEPIGVPSR